MENLKLSYLYRDGGNYKNYNEVVFSNRKYLRVDEIRNFIQRHLIDEIWFYADKWGLPDLHFKEYNYDYNIDVDWHEFENIEGTNDPITDTRDIDDFLNIISGSQYKSLTRKIFIP